MKGTYTIEITRDLKTTTTTVIGHREALNKARATAQIDGGHVLLRGPSGRAQVIWGSDPLSRRQCMAYLERVAPGDDWTGYTLAELRSWASVYSKGGE